MTATSSVQSFVIPEEPDRARMHRGTSSRLRAAMSDQGVDALILLMNDNVVYATGASWPVLDAGRCSPVIHATFPLAQAAEAHRLMESSQHIGKIMLTVG